MDVPKGLAGVVVEETKISSTQDAKLTFAGYPIEELKDLPYPAVVYLLWHQELPTAAQLKQLETDLVAAMALPAETMRLMAMVALEPQHPMSILRTTVSLLGTTNNGGKLDEPRQILGKMLAAIAAIIRLRDSQPQLTADPSVGVVANFMTLFMGRRPSPKQLRAFNTVMILHADHEFNASTFTSRVVASTQADYYSCLTAAVCALKGPLHGGANEQVFNMLQAIRHTGVAPQRYVDAQLAAHKKIMGFGHRVYKDGDPRAKILRGIAKEIAAETNNQVYFEIQEQLAAYMLAKLGLHPNVDYYTAVIYHCLGLDESTFTVMFAACRTAGWLAHIMEQRATGCLIRPASQYVGPTGRHVPEAKPKA
ncbi:MAG: citrate/2-methylcitrate synthase [Lactobacillus sp.]|jgi:citrate synthase|nr:citrate/2-methylcitrate synthase [Lactobacillus sp.]MCI2031933.1 citrate/2-methylcitrate synthase [Lactobacillus sp.]